MAAITPELFSVDAGFLDTASVGAPPRVTVEAIQQGLARWAAGRAQPQDYDAAVSASRASFARLVGVPPGEVCIGSQASALTGLIAASIPDGARVLAAEGEFTSLLFPFLAQEARGVEVRCVPLGRLAEEIDARTTLVAVSAVQSSSGALADLDEVADAAAAHGARTFVDATQAVGWLPLEARRFDYLTCAAYKWLLCPRGVAFMTIRPEHLEEVVPHAAGWYAAADIWSSIYGPPLRLATDARRLDVSPAWLAWLGAASSLAMLEEVGIAAIHAHDLALAGALRSGLGLPAGDSAIVRLEGEGVAERLQAADLRVSSRAGAARLSFHLHNTHADVDRALEALA
jgi:selenocysteine lyase/cysteine desulfurase